VTEAPVPSGGIADSTNISEVLCGSTCAASGDYDDANGRNDAFWTLSDGTWSVTDAPVPSGGDAGSADVGDFSCGSTCAASGDYEDANGYIGALWTLSDGTWNVTEAPVPSGGVAGSAGIQGVSCGSTCAASGSYEGASEVEYSAFWTLSDGTWSVTDAPAPSGGDAYTVEIFDLSCGSTCVASGYYDVANGGYVFWTLSEGNWSMTDAPVPSGGDAFSAEIQGVSCGSTCAAWGDYEDAASGDTFEGFWTLSDGTWSATEVPVPSGGDAGAASIIDFSCGSTCATSGKYETAGGEEATALWTLSDGTWSTTELPTPSGGDADTVDVSDVSCGSTCAASGTYEDASGDLPAGLWTASAVTPPSSTPNEQSLLGGGSPDVLPTTCSCGAPVNTDTGEFWHTFTDLSVPGRGNPLDLTRTYSSLADSNLGPFGYGWSDSYDMSLSFDASGNATVHEENSSAVTAQVSGTTYTFPSYVLATLMKNADGTFIFTRKDKSTYTFSATGRLTKETDRNGYVTSLTYNGSGQLTSVTDPAGRSLAFAYGTNGLISSVTDPIGRKVSFTYNSSKNLTRATDVGGKAWSFTYGADHLLLTMKDPRGGVTTNTYDGSNRVLSQADPMGRITTYSYSGTAGSGTGTTTLTDPRGEVTHYVYADNELKSTTAGFGTAQQAKTTYSYSPKVLGMTSVTDPEGHTTTYTYDAHGNVLTTTDPLGRTTKTTYDSFNEPLTVTDPMGVTTTYTYDASGNLLSKTTGSQTTSYTYGDSTYPGDVTASTDPDGNTTTYVYDADGDLISTTDPLGHTSTATYDAIGRKLTSTSPNGGVTTDTYDAFGDVPTTTDPLGHKTTNIYDADQNLVSTLDPVGNTTKYVFDADNELTKTTRPGNKSTSSTYDADGNVVSTTDADGHVTTNTYDPLNRLASTTDPLGHVTTNTYDLAGNRITQTNPSGQITTSTYDADNELISQSYSDGVTPAVTYAYDADGHRTSMTDGTGTTTYTYDSLGRLTASTNGAGQSTGYAYDAKGQLTSLTYPNGHSVTQAYDADGDLTSVTNWLGHTTTFTYDADGNLVTQAVPSTTPVVDTSTFNSADQLTSIADVEGTATLQGFAYTLTADAQVATATPTGQASQAYSYDALNQLTKDANGSYTYAADGSVTALLATKPMSYNVADQLVSSVTGTTTTDFAYDPQGNRVSASPSSGTATSYTFDQVGDMTGLVHGTTSATYAYNGDGLRMSKTVKGTTTAFSWDLSLSTPLLLSAGTSNYVYGPGGLPLEQITGTTVLYYHHDQLGSTTMLTNQAGATVATYTYDSYGKTLTTTGKAKNPLLFAGQYQDAESSLYYLRARYYDPGTGQFLSVDPLVAETGQPYSYATDDPVNSVDPTGDAWNGVCDASGCRFTSETPDTAAPAISPSGSSGSNWSYYLSEIAQQINHTGAVCSKWVQAHAAGIEQSLLEDAPGGVGDVATILDDLQNKDYPDVATDFAALAFELGTVGKAAVQAGLAYWNWQTSLYSTIKLKTTQLWFNFGGGHLQTYMNTPGN